MRNSEIRKIAFVGDYLPRKCGIATFTSDMYASVARRFPDAECFVVPVNDRPDGYDYPPEVRFEIAEQDLVVGPFLRHGIGCGFARGDEVIGDAFALDDTGVAFFAEPTFARAVPSERARATQHAYRAAAVSGCQAIPTGLRKPDAKMR